MIALNCWTEGCTTLLLVEIIAPVECLLTELSVTE